MSQKNKSDHNLPKLSGAAQAMRMTACIGLALSLTACGFFKPGVSDIEPFIVDQFGKCPLWDLGKVRKVDGMQEGNTYRIDFTFKITWKDVDEDARTSKVKALVDAGNLSCLSLGGWGRGLRGGGDLAPNQLEVSGFGLLVKSDNGWRLMDGLQPAQ